MRLFVNAGAGMMWTEEAFPVRGTHHNFTPQAGFGTVLRLGETLRLETGVQWHHISNASRRGEARNPGYDGAMVFAGLVVPF